MLKKTSLSSGVLLLGSWLVSSSSPAIEVTGVKDSQVGIQAGYNIATSGSAPWIGGVGYWSMFELGINASFSGNDASPNSTYVTLGGFLGGRAELDEKNYLGFGLDVMKGLGTYKGDSNFNNWGWAAYIGVEHYLSANLLLSARVNPWSWTSMLGVNTHWVFARGSVSVAWLF